MANTIKPLDPKLVQYILDTFTADFTTGQIFWKVNGKRKKAGDELPRQVHTSGGSKKRAHYKALINFEGKQIHLSVSRLMFILWHHRDVRPGYLVDHIDNNALNDTASIINGELTLNLRELTPSENAMNSRLHADSKTGFKGVHKTPVGKYQAQFTKTTNGVKTKHRLGTFATDVEAARAYDRGVLEAFGDIAYTNFPITDYQDIQLPKKKLSTYKGVTFHSGKFVSQFRHEGHSYYGGRFQTPGEAFAVTQSMRQGLGLKPYPQPVGV